MDDFSHIRFVDSHSKGYCSHHHLHKILNSQIYTTAIKNCFVNFWCVLGGVSFVFCFFLLKATCSVFFKEPNALSKNSDKKCDRYKFKQHSYFHKQLLFCLFSKTFAQHWPALDHWGPVCGHVFCCSDSVLHDTAGKTLSGLWKQTQPTNWFNWTLNNYKIKK